MVDGMLQGTVSFTLNRQPVAVAPAVGERLSASLRDRLGARDVKVGCNAGDCGACTVLVAGSLRCACLTPTHQVAGLAVDTAAGLVSHDPLTGQLAQSFQDHHAAQCGICTPGMLVAATALLRRVAAPTGAQVQDALGGVLCRCTGYRRIIDAVVALGTGWHAAPDHGPVGTAIRRVDGWAKLSGTEAFGDDVAPAGALVVQVIRSPHPHARFQLGDCDAFLGANPGLVAVLTAADVPGLNRFGVIPGFIDQPVFAETVALYRGDAVAAVVGQPEAMARFDPATFPITWHPLPAVQTVAAALAPDAPLLHPQRAQNVMGGGIVACGDAEMALARADVVATGRFTTGFVEHAYIEPEAGFAQVVGDTVEIHACTQAPMMDRDSLATILDMEPERVRIVPTAVGGGFGSKLDLSVQPFLALATIRTGLPVRMAYSRGESMQATTKRHPSDIQMRIGATRDGKLCGMTLHGDFNTGAYASWGPTVATRVPIHGSGPYRIADYRATSRAIHTHCPPSGAFRGFGVPQTAIAQESLFDELAARLGIDPLEFRIANALDNGEPTVCGQVFAKGVGIRACLVALRPAWGKALAEVAAFNAGAKGVRRGVGVASGWYGCGNTSLANPSTIKCGLRADGTLVLHQGAVDIGQGSNTVITQIFAEALGVPMAQVTLVGGDTGQTPDAGKTSASRQTLVSGNAALASGKALRAQVLRLCNAAEDAVLQLGAGEVMATDGAGPHPLDLSRLSVNADGYVLTATASYDPPTLPLDAKGQGSPYAQFGYAAQMVVVEVDLATGQTRALQFVAAHDVGKAINPALVEGQVQGGIAMGLGMALMEQFLPGRTENLHDYLIPTIGDVPPINTIIIEEPDAHGPYGAKGLGEHALIPTAPSILNAVRHAVGYAARSVPLNPALLLQAIREAGYV